MTARAAFLSSNHSANTPRMNLSFRPVFNDPRPASSRPVGLLRCLRAAAALALLLAPAVPLSAAPKSAAAETLVPANMQPQTDDKGNQWSLNNYGFLQNTGNSFFNNILMLHINGQQFYNYQPMQTADGKEFVLPAQQPLMGLQITRRVRLMEKEGVMRYVDLFHNPGSAPVTATAEYRNNFSAPVGASVTDKATLNPGALAKGETGLIVLPKQAGGQKACVFILGAPSAKLRPNFIRRGQYENHFSFALTVPPNDTIALCYGVALATAPAENDKAAVAKIFKATPAAKILKTLRREDLALLANFAERSGGDAGAVLAAGGLDTLEVERGRSDILAMGDKTRLTGTASCGQFAITTAYGQAAVPFEQIAAVAGGARAGGGVRVFLRDGQVFTGTAEAADLRFSMPSGARVDLDLATLDRLVRKEEPGEGKWDAGATAMLLTQQGDQIALGAGAASFEATTPWGPLAFSLDDVSWFAPSDDAGVGHQIEFKDGSRFYGFLSGAEITVPTKLFGSRTFSPAQVRALVTSAALAKARSDAADTPPDQPYVQLSGGQRLLARLDLDALTVLTGAKSIQVPPHGIRSLRNAREEAEPETLEADSPPFQIDLWGGGTMLGQVREPVLPFRVRNAVWSVPIADVVEIANPAPQVSDETRVKMSGFIRDLGSDAWEQREAASQALAEFGFMARPLLDEALKTTPDPEVRRRVEKLIDEME